MCAQFLNSSGLGWGVCLMIIFSGTVPRDGGVCTGMWLVDAICFDRMKYERYRADVLDVWDSGVFGREMLYGQGRGYYSTALLGLCCLVVHGSVTMTLLGRVLPFCLYAHISTSLGSQQCVAKPMRHAQNFCDRLRMALLSMYAYYAVSQVAAPNLALRCSPLDICTLGRLTFHADRSDASMALGSCLS
jgi:hypothetical protein